MKNLQRDYFCSQGMCIILLLFGNLQWVWYLVLCFLQVVFFSGWLCKRKFGLGLMLKLLVGIFIGGVWYLCMYLVWLGKVVLILVCFCMERVIGFLVVFILLMLELFFLLVLYVFIDFRVCRLLLCVVFGLMQKVLLCGYKLLMVW